MYEDDLGGVSDWMRGEASSRAKRGTYTVGEVYNQVVDLNFADLELAVQPAVV